MSAKRAISSSCSNQRQLIAIGTYAVAGMDEEADNHNFWCVDDLDIGAAEVAAGHVSNLKLVYRFQAGQKAFLPERCVLGRCARSAAAGRSPCQCRR